MKANFTTIALATLLGLNVSIAQVPANVPTSGLVGWWPFTGNTNDQSGNGNNGVLSGSSLTTDRCGISNSAYLFNGTSDKITCTVSSLPLGNSARSVSLWFNTSSGQLQGNIDPTTFGIAGYGGSTAGAVIFGSLLRTTNGKAYFESGSSQNQIYSTTSVFDGNWHNFILTYGGAGTRVRLYLDGIPEDSTAIVNLATANSIFTIGKCPWGSVFFQGKIDDVGMWNRKLTQPEITGLQSLGLTLSSPASQTVNVGSTVQFVVSSSTPSVTYQWQTNLGTGFQNVSNAQQYTGVTTTTLNVANTTLSNNNQPFRCIVSYGICTYTSTTASLTVYNTVSINNTAASDQNLFSVYPNPAMNQIHLKLNEKILGQSYNIIDQLGRTVLSGKITEENSVIEIIELPNGTYSMSYGNNRQTFVVIKAGQ